VVVTAVTTNVKIHFFGVQILTTAQHTTSSLQDYRRWIKGPFFCEREKCRNKAARLGNDVRLQQRPPATTTPAMMTPCNDGSLERRVTSRNKKLSAKAPHQGDTSELADDVVLSKKARVV
jgi:hypothetical protein